MRSFFALQKLFSFFSSPGQSPRRAIVLPPVSTSAAGVSLWQTLKFLSKSFLWARRCQESYPVPVTVLVQQKDISVFDYEVVKQLS